METSLLEAAIRLIQALGFPIFTAGWFMLRMEKRLDALNESLTNLVRAIRNDGGDA